jgi:hypothetical protein
MSTIHLHQTATSHPSSTLPPLEGLNSPDRLVELAGSDSKLDVTQKNKEVPDAIH